METKIEQTRYNQQQAPAPELIDATPNLSSNERNQKPHSACSNEYCTTDPENVIIRQISFNGRMGSYCDYCRDAINKKWVCPFCFMIFNEHAIYPDKSMWICCDNETCGRWSHESCESQYGNPNISNLLKNPNYKYMCLSCRNNKPKTKYGANESNGKKVEVKKVEKPMSAEEVRKLMITKKKPVQYNYTYLYSENYQTIEKLLNSCNCGFSLQLSDEQIDEDMRRFKELAEKADTTDKDITEVKVEGVDNLEKRTHKRFTQRGIRG